MPQLPPNPHKPYSVRHQPYRNQTAHGFKHVGLDLLSIIFILVTISSLTLATVHVLCNRDTAVVNKAEQSKSLVPAIYLQPEDAESLSI
jgi:hypothetical protein